VRQALHRNGITNLSIGAIRVSILFIVRGSDGIAENRGLGFSAIFIPRSSMWQFGLFSPLPDIME
jgi:hypothetical protein